MVYNKALNYKTRSKQYKHTDIPETGLVLELNPEDIVSVSQIETLVAKTLELLPEKCRVIFLLSREEELTYREIADQLDLSVKTVEAQMGIALQRFRKTIESGGSIPAGKIFIIFF